MSSKACTEPGFGHPVGAELAIPVWQEATQIVQAAMPQMMAVMIMVAATLIIPCHTLSGVLNTSQPGASVTRLFIAWALHPGSLDLLHSRSPMSCSFYVSSHAFPSAKLNLSIQELTLGTHGLPDEHIEVCKWCLEDIRLYIQLKPICKWLREKLSDSVEELIIQFSGHQLSRGQTLITHHHSRWRYYVTGDALPGVAMTACPSQNDAATSASSPAPSVFLSDHIFPNPNRKPPPEGTVCKFCGKDDYYYKLALWEEMGDDHYLCMTCFKINTLVKEMNSRVVIKQARCDVNELLDCAIYLARQQPLEANPNDVTRSAAGGSQEDHVR